jgi:hypothetical protein
MIRVFKMISGEELISKVTDSVTGWELDSPAVIMIQQTDKGVGVGLMPYMPYASGKITLHRTAVASDGTPDVKMENEYNRIFGSGIQIASSF